MALRCTRLKALVVTAASVAAVGLAGTGFGAVPAHGQGDPEDDCLSRAEGKNPIDHDDDPGQIIYGTPKSDHICGGPGRDIIVGGLLDDDIYGGGGNDLIIGGHGTDRLVGQSGDDWLRGGDNEDVNIGGPGNDTVSFADLTPVGGDEPRGVLVNLQAGRADIGNWENFEYGFTDTLNGVEDVVGSAFDDRVITLAGNTQQATVWGGPGDDELRGTDGNDALHGGFGLDACFNGSAPANCATTGQQSTRTGAAVYGETHGGDRGIVVLGTDVGNSFDVVNPDAQRVRVTGGSPQVDETHCTGGGPVNCTLDPDDDARYLVVWGDGGDDAVTFDSAFELGPGDPGIGINTVEGINAGTVDVNGGDGTDTLQGGPEDELLFSGEEGSDVMTGGPGADALISEGTGPDTVHGGGHDDQLVTDNACAGHHFWGDANRDIMGFARQTGVLSEPNVVGVDAQLGEGSTPGLAKAIRSTNEVVDGCVATTIHASSEVLEGTEQHDVLRGNNDDNTIWGRDAADDLFGRGGVDRVYGHTGDDNVDGGNGSDWLYGGYGSDSLDAREDPAVGDDLIDCGPGRDQPVLRGPGDRHVKRCEEATQASASVSTTQHGEPGSASVSGDVLTSSGEPARGYVTVKFDRYVNGTWTTERTAQRTLSDGHYEVEDIELGAGVWSARAVFPAGQLSYDSSTYTAPNFEIKNGYQIVARHSGRCLDVYGSGTANGQAIHQRDCLDPLQAPNQVFSLVPKWGDASQIVARHSGRCVDVAWESYAPGAVLQQFDCDPAGWANQLWWRDRIATGSPYFQLEAEHSGQCMDLQNGGTANGVRAVQWPCTDGRQSQHWELRPVNSSPIPRNVPPGGFNTVTHAEVANTSHGQPGLATVTGDVNVTNAPGETADGAYLHAYFSKWEGGQWVYKEAAVPTVENGTFRVDDWRVSPGRWRVMVAIPAQGPYNHSQSAYHEFEIKSGYEIVARHSDKCMTLEPNATESGGSIVQSGCTSTPIETDQVFSLVPMGGGYHQLRINSTGGCLDVSWASHDNGAYLQQWECDSDLDNQLWQVLPVAGQDRFVTLKAKHSGKCVDVAYGSADEGVYMQQWTCTSSYTHQHWTLEAVD